MPCLAAALGSALALRCLRVLLFKTCLHRGRISLDIPSTSGANDLTGESVSFGEIRVHGVGLILEQKETKETKNASHRIFRHIYQYQFVKLFIRPA